jgi:hypothetical protein
MSNDLKFWLTRIAFFALLALDAYVLTGATVLPPEEMKRQFVFFFVLILVTLPVGFLYIYQRSRRWESGVKPQDRIEVETLAELSRTKEANKQKKRR